MDIIDPNKWKPIKGRLYDPNKRKGYVAAVDGLINKVATPGLRAAAKAGTHSKKEEREVLEEMVLARVLQIAKRAAKAAKGTATQNRAGFDAIRSAYPGIEADLDEIESKHRDTNLGRWVYEHADLLIGPLHIGALSKSGLAQIQQARNAVPDPKKTPETPYSRNLSDEEKKYIQTTESPGIPRDLRVQWRTKGLPLGHENRKIIQGPDLALQYKEIVIPDPTDPSKEVPVNLNILLDAHGRLREDMLFPTSRNPYIQERARRLRKAFAETFAGNQIFGDTFGLRSKLNEWMDLKRYTPGRYRKRLSADKQKETGIERLYGTEEGRVRRTQITTDIAKKEFAAPINEILAKYFQWKSPSDYTGKEIAKAVGITDYSKCLDASGEFSGFKAAFLMHKKIYEDNNPGKTLTEQAFISRVTNQYYIQYGFREFRFPIKDDMGVPQPGTQLGMREYNDTGFRPDQEAAEAFVKDMLDVIGKKVFTGNSYTLGLGIVAETIQGPNGVRVKVKYADGRTLYFDPDNYWDVEARTMAVGEAAMMHQQIQALARDPINYAVFWYYNGVGNAMINMIPGARSAYNSTYRILKQRNSLLPKMDQLPTKAIKDWANLIVKRTILAPMYVYDPETNRAIPRYAYLIRSGINWGIDSLAGTELQPGALDKFLTKTGILGKYEWYWDSESQSLKKRAWEPRIFKSVMRSRRRKEQQSIFDLAIKMGTGIVFNMIGARILNIAARAPIIARSIYGIQQLRTFPMRAFNAGFRRLTVNGFVESLTTNAPPPTLLNKRFLGTNVYKSTQIATAGGGIWKVELTNGFRANLYKTLGKFFSQNGLTTTGNWIKLGWQAGGTILKTAGQAFVPAAMAGIVFNSPIAFIAAAVTSGVPLTFMNLANLADTNAFFTTTRVGAHFDTLAKLLYKPHAEAAVVLNPQSGIFTGNYDSLPKLFGLQGQIYKEISPGVWQLKNTGLARFLSNHANVRGLLKGTGRATYAFTIVYAITGSYVWAAMAAGSAIVLSIGAENLTRVIAEKLPAITGRLTAIGGAASTVGSLAMGGVTLAIGINFAMNTIKAWAKDGKEWEEWKNENFGNAISSSLSVMTIFGIVTSLASVYAAGSQFGRMLVRPMTSLIGRYSFLARGRWAMRYFGRWAQIGAITGFVIGAILGGIFGAQLGATLGGTVGGAIGGVVGGMLLGGKIGLIIGSLFSGLTAGLSLAIGGAIGAFIGGVFGGGIGATVGIIIEKVFRPQLEGLIQGFKTAFNLIGNALNILQAIKLLLSGNLADVGVGALMLCLAGVFTFSTLTTNSMTAASHVETEWTESGIVVDATSLNPIYVKDFKKENISFSDTELVYQISFSNTDPGGADITIKVHDIARGDDITGNLNSLEVTTSSPSPTTVTKETNKITIAENESLTITSGGTYNMNLTFTATGSSLPEIIGDGAICNTAYIEGSTDSGENFNSNFQVCVNKEGEVSLPPIVGIPGCPGNRCPTQISWYPPCNPDIIIIGTNPANQSSCDSPARLNVEYGTGNPEDPYTESGRVRVKENIESKLVSANLLGKNVTVHQLVAPLIDRITQRMQQYYVGQDEQGQYLYNVTNVKTGRIETLAIRHSDTGCYAWRGNVNQNTYVLSTHAFGAACDINWGTNWGLVASGTPSCDRIDIPPELVEIFEDEGWRWGGRFSTFDPMHFEYIPTCIGGNFGGE